MLSRGTYGSPYNPLPLPFGVKFILGEPKVTMPAPFGRRDCPYNPSSYLLCKNLFQTQ